MELFARTVHKRELSPEHPSAAEYPTLTHPLAVASPFKCRFTTMLLQDLEGQIAAQRDGMEELAGRTHQLVEENDQVPFRVRSLRLC